MTTEHVLAGAEPQLLEIIWCISTTINSGPSFSALVSFHLLDSVQCSEAIMAGTSYETLEGNNIEIGCDGESLTVNGIKMVRKKDIVTTNGVIHLIDQVLMPDSGKIHISSSCLSTIYCMNIYIVPGVWLSILECCWDFLCPLSQAGDGTNWNFSVNLRWHGVRVGSLCCHETRGWVHFAGAPQRRLQW